MVLLTHVWPGGPGKGKRNHWPKLWRSKKPKCGLTTKAEHCCSLERGKTNSRRKAKPQGIVMAVIKTEQGGAAAGNPWGVLGSAERDRAQSTEQECCSCPCNPQENTKQGESVTKHGDKFLMGNLRTFPQFSSSSSPSLRKHLDAPKHSLGNVGVQHQHYRPRGKT